MKFRRVRKVPLLVAAIGLGLALAPTEPAQASHCPATSSQTIGVQYSGASKRYTYLAFTGCTSGTYRIKGILNITNFGRTVGYSCTSGWVTAPTAASCTVYSAWYVRGTCQTGTAAAIAQTPGPVDHQAGNVTGISNCN